MDQNNAALICTRGLANLGMEGRFWRSMDLPACGLEDPRPNRVGEPERLEWELCECPPLGGAFGPTNAVSGSTGWGAKQLASVPTRCSARWKRTCRHLCLRREVETGTAATKLIGASWTSKQPYPYWRLPPRVDFKERGKTGSHAMKQGRGCAVSSFYHARPFGLNCHAANSNWLMALVRSQYPPF